MAADLTVLNQVSTSYELIQRTPPSDGYVLQLVVREDEIR